MSYRTFTDEHGVDWQAWDVRPRWAERRTVEDRRKVDLGPPNGIERRSEMSDRRIVLQERSLLTSSLKSGWLAFESATEKRRLSPIPEGWDALADTELVALCRTAALVPHARKRLIE